MKIITVGFGVLLILLGVGSYALFPAFLGLLICILGFIALLGKQPNNHPLFGAVMLAVLGLIGSLRSLWHLSIVLTGGEVVRPTAVVVQSIMGVLCVVFIVLALMLIKDFWHGWKAFGHFLGNLLARVVLSIFYFTIFVPFALGVRLFNDPLQIKNTPANFWRPRTTGDQTLEEVMRQY